MQVTITNSIFNPLEPSGNFSNAIPTKKQFSSRL